MDSLQDRVVYFMLAFWLSARQALGNTLGFLSPQLTLGASESLSLGGVLGKVGFRAIGGADELSVWVPACQRQFVLGLAHLGPYSQVTGVVFPGALLVEACTELGRVRFGSVFLVLFDGEPVPPGEWALLIHYNS